ncbi:hypothetical protein D4764_06G0008040 [Takifugu flavidus]|uniref:Uncharacterized protein n=1 Tax=Takifugu flavidus TaxID=433684 RepID=A0A5C6MVG2_9TELE|nr:hypothetical protein D4764_06G0008040 [Takifugu flavidus]
MSSIIHPDQTYCMANSQGELEKERGSDGWKGAGGGLTLPRGLQWKTGEIRYLGFFLGKRTLWGKTGKFPLKELKVGWRSGGGFSQRCPLEVEHSL